MIACPPHRLKPSGRNGFSSSASFNVRGVLFKTLALLLLAAMAVGALTGCATGPETADEKRLRQLTKWEVEQNFREGRPNWETAPEMGYYGPMMGYGYWSDPFGPGPM